MIIESNHKQMQKHHLMCLWILLTTELRYAVEILYFCSCLCCFQWVKFILPKRYRQKIFQSVQTTEVSRGGTGERLPSITAGKGCKRVGCVCTGGRTLSIDANPVAPHSTQFEERLWLLSENCDTPPHLNSKFNLLLLCLCLWESWIPTSLHLLTGTSTATGNSVFHLNEYWWELEVFTLLWWEPGSY